MKTCKTPLTILLATTAFALGTGCAPQKTQAPRTSAHVALSSMDDAGSNPLVIASGDTLGVELHLAVTE